MALVVLECSLGSSYQLQPRKISRGASGIDQYFVAMHVQVLYRFCTGFCKLVVSLQMQNRKTTDKLV